VSLVETSFIKAAFITEMSAVRCRLDTDTDLRVFYVVMKKRDFNL